MLGVWCVVSATIAFEPIFSSGTVNSERYCMQVIVSYFDFESANNGRR
jgi:hypothetical protein